MESLDEALQRARAKYGDNHWWESDDPRIVAYYQMWEPILCVDSFDKFHEAVESLVKRPVMTHEFGVNYFGLRDEVTAAYNGVPYTEDEIARNIRTGWENLFSKKKG